MSSIDRQQLGEYLTAYLDGELEAQEAATVEKILEQDAEAKALFEELSRTASLVGSLPRHQAPASMMEDIQRHIERDDLLGNPSQAEAVSPGRHRSWRPLLATAAVLAVIVGGGLWAFVELGGRTGIGAWQSVVFNDPKDVAPVEDDVSPVAPRTRRSQNKAALDEGKGPRAKGRAEKTVAFRSTPDGVGQDVAIVPITSKRRVSTAEDDREKRLADVLTLDQKIASGLSGRDALDHHFVNEVNTLRVGLSGEADRAAAAEKFTGYLRTKGVVDLRRVSRRRGVEKNGQESRQTFFLAGRAAVNFPADGGNQILVRVPADDIEDLVAELSRSAPDDRETVLRMGPVVGRGWDQTRDLVARISKRPETPVTDDRHPQPEPTKATLLRTTPDTEEFAGAGDAKSDALMELMAALGIDEETVTLVHRSVAERHKEEHHSDIFLENAVVHSEKDSRVADAPDSAGVTTEEPTRQVADHSPASPRAAGRARRATKVAAAPAEESTELQARQAGAPKEVRGKAPESDTIAEKQSAALPIVPEHVPLIERLLAELDSTSASRRIEGTSLVEPASKISGNKARDVMTPGDVLFRDDRPLMKVAEAADAPEQPERFVTLVVQFATLPVRSQVTPGTETPTKPSTRRGTGADKRPSKPANKPSTDGSDSDPQAQ